MHNDTILIVEDNRDDEELAVRALKKANLKADIVVVRDGAAALDFVLNPAPPEPGAPRARIRAILLDLKLPKLSGLEVLAAVRSRGLVTPIVLLSSSDLATDIAEAYRLGANSFVTKPVASEQYTETIRLIGTYWMVHNRPNEAETVQGPAP